MRALPFLLLCFLGLLILTPYGFAADPISISDSPLSGGEVTVFNKSREAFAKPAPNLPTKDLRRFTFGNKMFNTNWVTAPASVVTLDGLGPVFNRVSCAACHFKDGRGRPPRDDETTMNSMLMRLSIPGVDAHGGPNPHPIYGGQLNDRAILGVPAEGRARIEYKEQQGTYPDGTPYSLRTPHYIFEDMGFGELEKETMVSPRVAPAVFGLGLLEAMSEDDILSRADPEDVDGDGISGRPNYVWDATTQKLALGRFGWKANVATLREQDAGAAQGDMGITTTLFPDQNCTDAQKDCHDAPDGGAPEMSDMQLEKMTFYVSTLAVPARRKVDDEVVKRGALMFVKNNCAACHSPQMKTGAHEIAALAGQDIQPFSDMLLHDMGEGLADNRPDFLASGREWRTPPLWGIGLVKTVNRHTNFLHDGRARNLEEAILWHGGEAEASKNSFKAMGKNDRDALIVFLKSL